MSRGKAVMPGAPAHRVDFSELGHYIEMLEEAASLPRALRTDVT